MGNCVSCLFVGEASDRGDVVLERGFFLRFGIRRLRRGSLSTISSLMFDAAAAWDESAGLLELIGRSEGGPSTA